MSPVGSIWNSYNQWDLSRCTGSNRNFIDYNRHGKCFWIDNTIQTDLDKTQLSYWDLQGTQTHIRTTHTHTIYYLFISSNITVLKYHIEMYDIFSRQGMYKVPAGIQW